MRPPAIFARLACVAGVTLGTSTLATTALTTPAWAQEASKERAAAEALFARAVERMDAGDLATACPALEEVVRLQPSGIGALEVLSECHERAGRLASAWARARQAHDLALRGRADPARTETLRQRADALASRPGRLVTEVAPALRPIPGLRIVRDGLPVPAAIWGEPVAVDAGQVATQVEAPGHEPLVLATTIVDGRTTRLFLDRLGPRAVVTSAAPAPSTDAPGSGAGPTSPPREGDRPVWPWVVGGAGAASALATIPFIAWWADANGRFAIACPTVNASGAPECVSELDVAQAIDAERTRAAALAIAFGVFGVVGLGVGVVGLASSDGERAELAVGPSGVTVRGSW